MASPISALQSARGVGKYNSGTNAGVIMEEVSGFGMLQFSAWGEALAQTGTEAARVAGCTSAPKPGQVLEGRHGLLMRVEPLKWWLITHEGTDRPAPELPAKDGAMLDMLQSRCWLRIRGDRSETLLNHFLPLNLRPSVFPAGTVASTAFHHVGVTVWRDAQSLNLLIPRSSAVSLWELMSESARQYGLIEK